MSFLTNRKLIITTGCALVLIFIILIILYNQSFINRYSPNPSTENQESLNNNSNNTQSSFQNGHISEDSVPECENLDKNSTYNSSDIVTFEDGRVMVFQKSNPDITGFQKSYITICKHYVISQPTSEFSKEIDKYKILAYYPSSNILLVETQIALGENSTKYIKNFYDVDKKTLVKAEFPELDLDTWTSIYYGGYQFQYILYYPKADTSQYRPTHKCFSGYIESEGCKELKPREESVLNSGAVYLLRSDGKFVKLQEKNSYLDYKLDFAYSVDVANERLSDEGNIVLKKSEFLSETWETILSEKESELFK